MIEEAENLYQLAHVIINKLSWFTEAGRDNAHRIVTEAETAAAKKPAPVKKMSSKPAQQFEVEETASGKVVKVPKNG
jgi:hypothetical protein